MNADHPDLAHAFNIVDAWHWKNTVNLEVIDSGLINRSFAIRIDGLLVAVLQRINPIIVPPEVNEDIETITTWLTHRNIETPRLIRTKEGGLWATDHEGGNWRCLTHVGQITINTFTSNKQARSAARLVARVHEALKDLDEELQSPKQGAQDTEKHLANLRLALASNHDHRLFDHVAPIAEVIENTWASWQGPKNLPIRIIHGDLKLSNIRFDGDEAVALIDLDTFTNSTLDVELGDALRSWCNTAGEDSAEATFDLDIFSAAIQGFWQQGFREQSRVGIDHSRPRAGHTQPHSAILRRRFAGMLFRLEEEVRGSKRTQPSPGQGSTQPAP